MSANRMNSQPAPDRWPRQALVMMAVGVVLLAAPASVEGPVILPISPGHALSVLDAIAVLPLLAGSGFLYHGLWRRRRRLQLVVTRAPSQAVTVVFAGGFGLGLLIASAFSAFFWWWAIGAVVFASALVGTVLVAAREEREKSPL